MALTAAQIRARIEADQYGYHDGGDDWDYEIAELLSKNSVDAVHAWTHAQEQFDNDALFEPEEIAEAFLDTYRQQWDTAADFARQVAEDETTGGDPEEAKGRAWFLEHYSEFIDWDAFAASPQVVDTYTLVMLDQENSRVVHAFAEYNLRES